MSQQDEEGFQKTMILAPSARTGEQKLPEAELICANPDALPDPVYARIRLHGEGLTIGRSGENTVSLNVDGMSRQHARLFPGGDMWGIQDLGSTNGVLVNGTRIKDTWLKHGDKVQIGRLRFTYEDVDRRQAPAPAATDDAGAPVDKTMVMGSGGPRAESAPGPAPAPEPAARQGDLGGATTQQVSRPAAAEAKPQRRRTATAKEPGSGVFPWLLGGLVVILLIALVSFFL
jgi:hypothetical protein